MKLKTINSFLSWFSLILVFVYDANAMAGSFPSIPTEIVIMKISSYIAKYNRPPIPVFTTRPKEEKKEESSHE